MSPSLQTLRFQGRVSPQAALADVRPGPGRRPSTRPTAVCLPGTPRIAKLVVACRDKGNLLAPAKLHVFQCNQLASGLIEEERGHSRLLDRGEAGEAGHLVAPGFLSRSRTCCLLRRLLTVLRVVKEGAAGLLACSNP